MKHISRRYVQSVNRAYRRGGTLWDGWDKLSLLQADRYLLACYRYIELNPVRIALVEQPWGYYWSSYHANNVFVTDT